MGARTTLLALLLLASACAGSEAFVGGGMLFRDGSYLTGADRGYADSSRQTFGQESFDDEPFLFAGLSFPIGPEPTALPPAVATGSFQEPLQPTPTQALIPGPDGRITIPGFGDVEVVVPEGNPLMVVALSVLVLACGVTAFLWWRRKRKVKGSRGRRR